jgi:hypothetical protein
MITVSSKTAHLQIHSRRLQKAVDETVHQAERVVGQIETLAIFAKSTDNTPADRLPQRGCIQLDSGPTGQPIDLRVRVKSNGPQPMDGVTEFICSQAEGERFEYSRDAKRETFCFQQGNKTMTVLREFGSGALTILEDMP